MTSFEKIINTVNVEWNVENKNLVPKKNQSTATTVALKSINAQQNEENNSWFSTGYSFIANLTDTLEEYDQKFGEIMGVNSKVEENSENKTPQSEKLRAGLVNYFESLEKISTGEDAAQYDLAEICDNAINYLIEYREALASEFEISNELDSLNLVINKLSAIRADIQAEKQNAANESSLGNMLNSWVRTFDSASSSTIEHLKSIANALPADQMKFLNELQARIADLLPPENDGRLFSVEEEKALSTIRGKISDKTKLSKEEVEQLLVFSEREKKLETGVLEIIKDKLLYEHSFLTKNFVSLLGASIAGVIAGPTAAFAAHHCIGSIWGSYVSDANPKNRVEQIAMLMVNGVVGSATGGISGALACTSSQALQDEAPTVVNQGISSASMGYLAHLAGASTATTLKVGLFGLLLLKGRQTFQAIKDDIVAVGYAIKNPRTIPSSMANFITKIAKDTISAFAERKWIEVGSLASVAVISLGALALSSSLGLGLGLGIATALGGLYLNNRIFHSGDTYKGGASLANPDYRQWVARQLELISAEDQMESMKDILKETLGESYEAAVKAVDKLTSNAKESESI